MTGVEDPRENDLFFVCSLIEAAGRETRNHRRVIVNALGLAGIRRYWEFADVFHCETFDKLVDDLTKIYFIKDGTFDNVNACCYRVPTIFELGRVYQRLIVALARVKEIEFPVALIEVYNSWIADKLDDYNSSMYFENPDYIFQSYLAGQPLPE